MAHLTQTGLLTGGEFGHWTPSDYLVLWMVQPSEAVTVLGNQPDLFTKWREFIGTQSA